MAGKTRRGAEFGPKDIEHFDPDKLFWPKVDIKGDDECWKWTRSLKPNGYGQIGIAGMSPTYAHRVAFVLGSKKAIPAGIKVTQVCRNKLCVNPRHLRLTTDKEIAGKTVTTTTSSSFFRFITWHKDAYTWHVSIPRGKHEKSVSAGLFTSLHEAVSARDRALRGMPKRSRPYRLDREGEWLEMVRDHEMRVAPLIPSAVLRIRRAFES